MSDQTWEPNKMSLNFEEQRILKAYLRPDPIAYFAELDKLRAENERLNYMLKTHKVLENFKSYEKCAKDLAHHKKLLVERDRVLGVAKVALEELAILGGTRSEGNQIAQRALSKIKESVP